MHGALVARRSLFAVATIAALGASGCGGGGRGDPVIPPFWLRSGIVAADFDGDGRTDVAVAASYLSGPPPHAGYVEVYLQSAPGVFSAPVAYPVAPDPWGLAAGDLDGDGRLDLVAATPATVAPQPGVTGDSGEISLLRQDPSRAGTFLAATRQVTGGAATDAAIAELTGDGRADLIVADGVLANGRALLLPQSASQPGTLLAPSTIPLGSGRGSDDLAIGDLNGDGRPDLAFAVPDGVAIVHGNATGGLGPVQMVAAGIRPDGVAMADLDGDDRLDIVVANAGNADAGGTGSASVTLLRQTIAGQFVAASYGVADGARRVAIADLNGDGAPDVAVISLVYQSQSMPSRITVLLQSPVARGQFASAGVYDGPYSGNFIAVGDANGDGLNDLFVNDGLVVLLQRAAAPGTFDPPRALR